MSERVEHYKEVVEEAEVESLTVVLVAGATVADVRGVIAADAGLADGQVVDDDELSAYTFAEVAGGVLAMEHTGFAAPTVEALRQLSTGGRGAAVVGSDIQAWDRFGCARDGVVLFDDPEYTYLDADDLSRVPDELRPLFDLAWVDLDSDEEDDESESLAFAVGLAMAEVVTGIRITAEDLYRDWEDETVEVLPVRTLAYAAELSAQREADEP
ncbi:hypothetical protein J2X46_000931 [Nocardioides sp. BE266]|uniref:DUF6461 domain-containing protein n=1 Tax=Nocardioides sp. BE266 TaxID=2817725 RepID=UPI00285AB056|nr:DUF6461 domain-containing protein [Nocardioides sp. BE266]MDR7251955.1 hypothetical protein [Nocardioides sp. BE266]